jgi:uncharacterized membrane protein YciS (DUF1049 family)
MFYWRIIIIFVLILFVVYLCPNLVRGMLSLSVSCLYYMLSLSQFCLCYDIFVRILFVVCYLCPSSVCAMISLSDNIPQTRLGQRYHSTNRTGTKITYHKQDSDKDIIAQTELGQYCLLAYYHYLCPNLVCGISLS